MDLQPGGPKAAAGLGRPRRAQCSWGEPDAVCTGGRGVRRRGCAGGAGWRRHAARHRRLLRAWRLGSASSTLESKMRPKLWTFERQAAAMGYQVVAGVDEVGMGPLAGPVVGGAVVLHIGDRIPGLNDSKLMTADERDRVDSIIRRRAVAVAVCAVDHTQIVKLGLYKARQLAHAGAVAGLSVKP